MKITPHNPLDGERPDLNIKLHDGSESHVSIVVVHKDQPPYLNICLQTIAVCSFNNNYEIIVSDNGSGKETQDFLDELQSQDIKVVKNDKNLYFSAAANKGASCIDKHSKYIIFMHSDVVVLNPAWIDLLISVSETNKSGMVGIELHTYYLQDQKVDFIEDWLVLFTRECWEACGPWPEQLPQVGHGFIMTMLAQQKGFHPQIMRNPICHHYRTFGLDINEYERLTENAMITIPKMINDIRPQAV